MVLSPNIDPCQFGGALEQVCDRNKFNSESSGLRLAHWILIGAIIIVCDVLKWFPQVAALFSDPYIYAIANLLVDLASIILYFVILGFPGLIVSLLKLFDSMVFFLLGGIFPILIPIAFWVEVFPWFMFAVGAYFVYKAFILKKVAPGTPRA